MAKVDHCVFLWNFSEGDFIILLFYMDDMLIVEKDTSRIKELKNTLSESFSMKDLGETRKSLVLKFFDIKMRRSCTCHRNICGESPSEF